MNTIKKNTAVLILVLFALSIVPFPLFAVETQGLASLLQDVSNPSLKSYNRKITPETDSIVEYNGIKLEIPSGAVDKEVTIEIIKLETAPGINETIKNVTTGAVSYRFLPNGIKFKKNIKISIPFDKVLLESETALSNLFTYFYDEENGNWERLPRVGIDRGNAVVLSLTNHFTDMINATLKMPESPEPVNFDINSIKNLEAANPSSGVMSLKGLTPDSQGSASFQIPLNLPPGRGSAYPNIALSYNCDSPNSWMGRGFDISVPSITTDTKFGLPKYDDTDTYILGGEELVLIAGASGFPKRYSPRVEKDFKRIIRKFEGGVDYWEVTDKNGRVQTFGTEDGWIGPDRNNHAKTYTWYLTKETDPNGNFVSYIYDYDSVNKYTYLKEIRYSGNNNVSSSDNGPYKVVFNTSESRPDRRMDARGTFVSKLIRRLDEVQISYNGEVFRTYTFGYEQNEFGQTVLKKFTESDGSGNEFYEYGFDYNTLKPHDAGTGVLAYDGFGTETIEWGAVSGSTFPGLNRTTTFGAGASLYLGVNLELLVPKSLFKWYWKPVANIGVSGGVNFSGTIANSTLMDINGDNLPDAVWKNGETLNAYKNTGFGFDTSTGNDISRSGLPGLLNNSFQKGYNLGVSARVGSAGGSFSWQNDWTEGLTAFKDINGDGLIDYVKTDDNSYYKNTSGEFKSEPYISNAVVGQVSNINEEDYQRTYYLQEPVRKWKAFTSGTIDIFQSSALVKVPSNPDEYEGVKAVTYLNNGDSYLIELTGSTTSGTDTRGFISVRDGDEVFFHMDAGNDTRGDDINWNIDIAYTDIDYFEGIDDSAIITLTEQYSPYLPGNSEDEPDNDHRLDNLYDKEDIQVYPPDPDPMPDPPPESLSPIWEYTLKANWRDYIDAAAVDAIVDYGLFIPGKIPEDIFTKVFAEASDSTKQYFPTQKIIPGGKAKLIDAYSYHPEFKDFIRLNSTADMTIREVLPTVTLSSAEKRGLIYYTDFSGSSVVPEESGGVKSFIKSAPLISIDPHIDANEINMAPGSELYNGEILLDKIYNETGDEVIETLSLIPDNGSLQLISTDNQGSGIVDGSAVSESADGINISFLRNGIKHSYSLSSPESILTGVPSEIYNSAVLDAVTSDYNFAYFPSYASLSIAEYNTVYGAIDVQADKDFFETTYERYPEIPDIEEYILKDPMSTEELDHLIAILTGDDLPDNYRTLPAVDYDNAWNTASSEDRTFLVEIYSRSPEIPPLERYNLKAGISSQDETGLVLIFDGLSDNADSVLDSPLFLSGNTESVGIIALNEAEYTEYFEGDPGVQSLFNEVADSELNNFYILKQNLTDPEKTILELACRQYLRDEIEFPYYEYNEAEGLFTIKSGLNSAELTEISTLFSGLGLSVFTELNRNFRYYSNAVLPVTYESTDPVSSVGNSVPEGNEALVHNNPGMVRIPSFDSNGRSLSVIRYIHQFNTEYDYSTENIITYPKDSDGRNIYNEDTLLGSSRFKHIGNSIPEDFEVFSGGVGGWYYGVWTGYYGSFDKSLIRTTPAVSGDGEVGLPKYFASMEQNKDNGDHPRVSKIGKMDPIEIGTDALVSDISSYVDSSFTDGGVPESINYKFAPVIDGNIMHSDRNGGDTYFNVPRGSTSISGGKIGNISESRSEAKDVNGSISGIIGSLSLSYNEGKSWQYQELMDINGDRYPDIISYPSGKGGSTQFSVLPGTGSGFANSEVPYNSHFSHLSYNVNKTFGIGASPQGLSMNLDYNKTGSVRSSYIGSPQTVSGGINRNETFGVSYRTEGFMDITGDGLPDHVKRSGDNDYYVSVGTGVDFTSIPIVDFGSGINQPFYDISGLDNIDLLSTPHGISFSNSGSSGLGANTSLNFSGSFLKSVGANAGFSFSTNRTLSRLMDINGDGLIDQVYKKLGTDFFKVRFNLGDRFSDDEILIFRPSWDTGDLSLVMSGLNTILNEIGNTAKTVFKNLGIPGINIDSLFSLAGFPEGTGGFFSDIIDPFKVDDTISYTGGFSINLGANLTLNLYELNLVVARLGLQLIPGINGSYAVSTTNLSMQDINGDGLPDHVLKRTGNDELKIKINSMGKAGLLNKIILPTGGSIDLEYGREGNTVTMPQNRYVLKKVIKNDGYGDVPAMTGEHSYTETFDYSDGYYDRLERKFYGFKDVSVTKGDGSDRSVITTSYSNNDYYTKGLVLSTKTNDQNNKPFISEQNTYGSRSSFFTGGEVVYPYLTKEVNTVYDFVDENKYIETEKEYFYDNFGNVIKMEDRGIVSDTEDNISLSIEYSDNYDTQYLKSLPTSLTVRDSTGKIIRKREGSYDGRGNLVSLRNYYIENDYSEYTFGYGSEYGNLISVEDPLGYRKEYTYDSAFHRYVTEIETLNNSGGDSYISNLSYDYRFGVETSQTDSNGNTMIKEYDSFGRLGTIISPYDTGTVKAVEYSYLTDIFPWKALTKNKKSFNAADAGTMDTWVIIDGLNRIISTSREGEVYNKNGNQYGWNKSGYVVYDSKGRSVEEGQTVFEETSAAPGVEVTPVRPISKTYDALDRILTITFPDNSVITKNYGVDGNRTTEKITDPLGNITETYKYIRGNIVKIEKKDSSGTLLTESAYSYNELGKLLKVTDAKGSDVDFTYDILGRRKTTYSSETGLTEFEYDKADHLIRKVDANLRNNGAGINYIYDTLGRIEKIDYPFMTDILYTYGARGDSDNRAGRIVKITDESGSTENYYGKLGETTQVIKTIKRLTPLEEDKTAAFDYTFDYQGRMETITYPDGEFVSYTYNRGGEVEKISSAHNGLNTTYIENIGYDEYGQRAYMKYGNGIETKYTYDEDRRWLNNIETKNAFNTLQDIDYTFDRTGNILSIINVSGRYLANQNYEYDGLYQLTKGAGYFEDKEFGFVQGTSNYTQNFTYDNTGNILSKTSSNIVNPSGGVNSLNYNLEYTYYADKPKQAEIIGNLWYLYDSNGNIMEERTGGHSAEGIQGSGTITKNGEITEMNRGIALTRNTAPQETVYKRTYIWDEENRLKTTIDPSNTVEYRYDNSGERTNKMSDNGGETLYFNSMWLTIKESYDFRQSKNIYLGETRIATRLNMESDPSTGYESVNTYYYHGDHLGSSNIVTTPDGEVFEHIEYTPYGETWIEKTDDYSNMLPYKFTAKELDSETGLYYYGARYLNPRTSRWISSDPAFESYIPNPGKNPSNLPGGGGIFNTINLNIYVYAGNNPVTYIDPDGLVLVDVPTFTQQSEGSTQKIGTSGETIKNVGCVLTSYARIASAISGSNISLEKANQVAMDEGLYTNGNELSTANGAKLIGALTGKEIGFSSVSGSELSLVKQINNLDASNNEYYATGRINTSNPDGTKKYGHHVNITQSAGTFNLADGYTQPLLDTSNTGRTDTSPDGKRPNDLIRVDYFWVRDANTRNQVE